MGAAGAGDIRDAGVPARDAELDAAFELDTGAAAWAVDATSSAAGCAMVARHAADRLAHQSTAGGMKIAEVEVVSVGPGTHEISQWR